MQLSNFVKKHYRLWDHVLCIFIWLFIEAFAHLIFYGGGINLSTILANHGWYVFSNLNLPVDQAIQNWGSNYNLFWKVIGLMYDFFNVAFSIAIYVLVGRKYFIYWAKIFIISCFVCFLFFVFVPIYIEPVNSPQSFVSDTDKYYLDGFGCFPSLHNINIQIFIFPIILSKIKKEKYDLKHNVLIWIVFALVVFFACATFIGRIVQKFHYFIDGIGSITLCTIVSFAFMKCKYMWEDDFLYIRIRILKSKLIVLWTILIFVAALSIIMTHFISEVIHKQ